MHFDVLTLFPEMFEGPFSSSIIKRAVEAKRVSIKLWNIRDYTHDRHHTADDYPYGGGAGMVLKPEPVFETVDAVKQYAPAGGEADSTCPVILLSAQGRLFNQAVAQEFSKHNRLVLICGHYEGVDERIVEHLATDEISIGDYVLSGGEPAAIVVVDAITRLLPGVLGSSASLMHESHTEGLLEYPQYTHPPEYRGWKVPEVLLSGNHGEIAKWRREQSVARTVKRRPDLLPKANLTEKELRLQGSQ